MPSAILSTLVRHYGEPYGDSSAVPTFYVSQAARRHVTVALNGDGGDEVFAGYERYRAMRLAEKIPSWMLRLGTGAVGAMPKQVNLFGRRASMERTLQAATLKSAQRYLRWQSVFSVEQKYNLYTNEFREAAGFPETLHPLCQYFEGKSMDIVDACQLADTMTYLPDDLLAKVDITSMANSLEARSPFLDHPLMEWAATLPVNLKLHGTTGKHILRRAIQDLVPAENMQRRKMGFGIPVRHWFRHELKELLHDTVISERALARDYFKPDAVRDLVEEHISGQADHAFRLWSLLMLELWHQEFVD